MKDLPRSRAGFEWTCPICGKTRLNTSGERNGVAALRSHVLASDGAGHGPRNEYPAGFDPDSLGEHVARTEGPGRPLASDE